MKEELTEVSGPGHDPFTDSPDPADDISPSTKFFFSGINPTGQKGVKLSLRTNNTLNYFNSCPLPSLSWIGFVTISSIKFYQRIPGGPCFLYYTGFQHAMDPLFYPLSIVRVPERVCHKTKKKKNIKNPKTVLPLRKTNTRRSRNTSYGP